MSTSTTSDNRGKIKFLPDVIPTAVHMPIPGRKKVESRQRRHTGDNRTSVSRHADYLVFKNGGHAKKRWVPKADGKFTKVE